MSGALTCDTSVLVAGLLVWHPHHEEARSALADVTQIPAHVLLETYSLLTRLPGPHRLSADDAGRVVGALPFELCQLPVDLHRGLIHRLAAGRVSGGAVYDALIGATAAHHGLTLLTRDRRARATYDVVAASYSVL